VANLLRNLLTRANETTPISITDYAKTWRPGQRFVYQGVPHTSWSPSGALNDLIATAPIVFAVEQRRLQIFSEARFQFQQLRSGRPGELFGTPALAMLEEPWRGASTRDLLGRVELDAAACGNSYWIEDQDSDHWLIRLDPSKVTVLTEAYLDPTTGHRVGERLIGYAYAEEKRRVTVYDASEVFHHRPIPHPNEQFLGMAWISACLPDIEADRQITQHRTTTLRSGANLNIAVIGDPTWTPEQFQEFVDEYRRTHEGPENSGKTLFLSGGVDVKTVGQTFADLAMKAEQGAGETRIAAAAGVHPVVAGLSEGMQGSSLNAGNYSAAKRNFVDGTMRPLWGAFSSAFQSLIGVPEGSRLWYDDRDIPFLREDVLDQAEVLQKDALTARQLIDAGFDPDAVITAVAAGDLKQLLGQHSGLYSVQLQAPGSGDPASSSGPEGAPTP
jgi:hypothetical protein